MPEKNHVGGRPRALAIIISQEAATRLFAASHFWSCGKIPTYASQHLLREIAHRPSSTKSICSVTPLSLEYRHQLAKPTIIRSAQPCVAGLSERQRPHKSALIRTHGNFLLIIARIAGSRHSRSALYPEGGQPPERQLRQ
jgi:hypothetical protein